MRAARRAASLAGRSFRGFCLPLLLAACGSADARTTLTVSNWAGWQELRLEEAYIGAFAARRPGVRVRRAPQKLEPVLVHVVLN